MAAGGAHPADVQFRGTKRYAGVCVVSHCDVPSSNGELVPFAACIAKFLLVWFVSTHARKLSACHFCVSWSSKSTYFAWTLSEKLARFAGPYPSEEPSTYLAAVS